MCVTVSKFFSVELLLLVTGESVDDEMESREIRFHLIIKLVFLNN